MNKVFIFSKYSAKGASSRYRLYSYLAFFKHYGIVYSISPLFGDWYLNHKYSHKSKFSPLFLTRIFFAYLHRILRIFFIPSKSVVYIGAELLPYFPMVFESYLKWRCIPYVVEFDDAVFHNYDKSVLSVKRWLYGRKFKKVIHNASAVICGCRYLADYSRQWNDKVTIIPTCVDGEKYNVPLNNREKLVIGWIGSPSSSSNISIVIDALKKLKENQNYELHLVGFDSKYEYLLEGIDYRIEKWTEKTEIEDMAKFTIGIMPLSDTPFSRGKCAFKLVQYMAMGIPTVSTPLQSNVDIDRGCGNLFASNTDEWVLALENFLNDKALREEVGARNKETAMKYYTFQATYKEKIEVLRSVGNDIGFVSSERSE